MGEVRVPARAKWRAQTQRAVENFPISGQPIERELIRGLALIKGFGARVRAERGLLDADKAAAISAVGRSRSPRGDWDAEFPIDVFQTGSGTSSNMNANEVIATLASERLGGAAVHPNDDVNDPLSSNDQFPSAIHVAATNAVVNDLIPALRVLRGGAGGEGGRVRDGGEVRADAPDGRDAGDARAGVRRLRGAGRVRHRAARVGAPRLAELPLGGTAVGTGINAPAGFAAEVIALIAAETGLPLTEARNHFEAQGARDALVETSGQLRTIAVGLIKITNDLRWMGSGPRTGPGRDRAARPAAGLVDHAGQGQPGHPRGGADGRRAGDRQRRGRGVRRARPATSSST